MRSYGIQLYSVRDAMEKDVFSFIIGDFLYSFLNLIIISNNATRRPAIATEANHSIKKNSRKVISTKIDNNI